MLRSSQLSSTASHNIPSHSGPVALFSSYYFSCFLPSPFNLLSFQVFSSPSIAIYPPLSIHSPGTSNTLLPTHDSPHEKPFSSRNPLYPDFYLQQSPLPSLTRPSSAYLSVVDCRLFRTRTVFFPTCKTRHTFMERVNDKYAISAFRRSSASVPSTELPSVFAFPLQQTNLPSSFFFFLPYLSATRLLLKSISILQNQLRKGGGQTKGLRHKLTP